MAADDLSYLKYCLEFDAENNTYSNGQHIAEALWRTLICDCSQDVCPAPPEIGEDFCQFLVGQLIVSLLRITKKTTGEPQKLPQEFEVGDVDKVSHEILK